MCSYRLPVIVNSFLPSSESEGRNAESRIQNQYRLPVTWKCDRRSYVVRQSTCSQDALTPRQSMRRTICQLLVVNWNRQIYIIDDEFFLSSTNYCFICLGGHPGICICSGRIPYCNQSKCTETCYSPKRIAGLWHVQTRYYIFKLTYKGSPWSWRLGNSSLSSSAYITTKQTLSWG